MIAYQMIYTAAEKIGGFNVWSKSKEITVEECDDITKLMAYRTSCEAPTIPTEEQAKTLYPKKYAYFTLSSGRKCLAQTNYVVKNYSDKDQRYNNYVIHAFVFDDAEEINPFQLLNSSIFKTHLTYKEWHDDDVPESLPPIDIKNDTNINDDIVKKYLFGSHRKEMLSLLQAIINIANTDLNLVFNDSEENQKEIYSLIGGLLPKCIIDKLTFSNQYLSNNSYLFAQKGIDVKIRNIFNDEILGGFFNPQEELDAGQLLFIFNKNIYSNIGPKRYLNDIVHSLENDNSYQVANKIQEVHNIMQNTQCDVDTAICLYHMMKKELSWFNGVKEFFDTFEIALKYHYVSEQEIAIKLYSEIILSEKWGSGRDIFDLIKFTYKNVPQDNKNYLIEYYIKNINKFVTKLDGSPDAVLGQIKNNSFFLWDEFALTIVRNSTWKTYIESVSDNKILFTLFDAVVLALTKDLSIAEKNMAQGLLSIMLNKVSANKEHENIKPYLERVKQLGVEMVNKSVLICLGDCMNYPIDDPKTFEFVFQVILSLDSKSESAKLLNDLVNVNGTSKLFLKIFVSYEATNKEVFELFESIYGEHHKNFFFVEKAYVFENTKDITYKMLEDYFVEYYKTGNDAGKFLVKLQQYIKPLDYLRKKDEIMRIYNLVKTVDNSFKDILSILDFLNTELFTIQLDVLLKENYTYLQEIVSLNERLISANIAIPEMFLVLRMILILRGALRIEYSYYINNNSLYDSLNDKQFDLIIRKYFCEIINFYAEMRRHNNSEVYLNGFVNAILVKPLSHFKDARNEMSKALKELNESIYYFVMADIFSYALNENSDNAKILNNFIRDYIKQMSRREYKLLFKKIIPYIPVNKVNNVSKFVDNYLDENMSFLEKLFKKKQRAK